MLISGTAYDHLQGKLDLPLEFAGEQRLKNIERPIRTYRIRLVGARAAPLPSRLRSGRHGSPAAAVLLILGLGTGLWFWWGADKPAASLRPAIAVLPFTTTAADEATNRLANGLTDDIITDLARQNSYDVIARASTEAYRGRPTDVRQVGRDLAVRFVLEGSIQREGDQLRATARLSDTATGAQVWSNRWDRPATDLFAIQTDITEQVDQPVRDPHRPGEEPGSGRRQAQASEQPDRLRAHPPRRREDPEPDPGGQCRIHGDPEEGARGRSRLRESVGEPCLGACVGKQLWRRCRRHRARRP